jgi:hypothetical protein
MSTAVRAQDMIHARYFAFYLYHSFHRLFLFFLRSYIHTTRYHVQILDQNQKKDDIIECVVCDNNQNTSLNVVLDQNLFDNFRQSLFCMFFFHIFKLNQYFMIISILVYEKNDYEQIWLTIWNKSTIQCKWHLDFIKKILE